MTDLYGGEPAPMGLLLFHGSASPTAPDDSKVTVACRGRLLYFEGKRVTTGLGLTEKREWGALSEI